MKKLLLIALAICGVAFVPTQRADAQITAGLPGVGGISFGFPGYRYAYPTRYSYSQPYSYYYSGTRYSWYNGGRTYHRHHRHYYHHHD